MALLVKRRHDAGVDHDPGVDVLKQWRCSAKY